MRLHIPAVQVRILLRACPDGGTVDTGSNPWLENLRLSSESQHYSWLLNQGSQYPLHGTLVRIQPRSPRMTG